MDEREKECPISQVNKMVLYIIVFGLTLTFLIQFQLFEGESSKFPTIKS